jgi:hypothetical protein
MNKNHAKEELKILIERYNKILHEEPQIKSKQEEKTKKDLILPLC